MLRSLSLNYAPVVGSVFAFRPLGALLEGVVAVFEGVAASRRYQQLRTLGFTQDAAIREVFGIDPARQLNVGSIDFAGQV